MDHKDYNIDAEYLLYLKWSDIYTQSKDEERRVDKIIPYLSWDIVEKNWINIWVEKFCSMMIRWCFFRIEKIWNNYVWYSIEDYIIVNNTI